MIATLVTWLMASSVLAGQGTAQKLATEFEERHPELRLAKSADVAACAKPPRGMVPLLLLSMPLTSKENPDAFFFVASRSTPTRFGLLVWVKGDSHDEQWVVPLGPRILTGWGTGGPKHSWLLVSDCATAAIDGYRWNGRAFEYAGKQ